MRPSPFLPTHNFRKTGCIAAASARRSDIKIELIDIKPYRGLYSKGLWWRVPFEHVIMRRHMCRGPGSRLAAIATSPHKTVSAMPVRGGITVPHVAIHDFHAISVGRGALLAVPYHSLGGLQRAKSQLPSSLSLVVRTNSATSWPHAVEGSGVCLSGPLRSVRAGCACARVQKLNE